MKYEQQYRELKDDLGLDHFILHNRRLLGMLDSFRRNAPLRR